MANPRRSSSSYSSTNININNNNNHQSSGSAAETNPAQFHGQQSFSYLSVVHFLKKPHAFPFLLSVFVLLTWVSLRLQVQRSSSPSQFSRRHSTHSTTHFHDSQANLRRFSSDFSDDKRGWLINPVSLAIDSDLLGGAVSCASVHVGEIRPGGIRGNHRHHSCNETFVIWGAKTKFRLENNQADTGYAEAIIGADEVAVAASPRGTAHAIVNMDPIRTTFLLGCQDSIVNNNSSTTDFSVWNDL